MESLQPSIAITKTPFQVIEDMTVYKPREWTAEALEFRQMLTLARKFELLSYQECFQIDNHLCKRFGFM